MKKTNARNKPRRRENSSLPKQAKPAAEEAKPAAVGKLL